MQTLDKLDVATSLNRILRRFHLARLLDYRVRQEEHHRSQQPQRTTRRLKYGQERIELLSRRLNENNPIIQPGTKSRQSGRADTKALDDLMVELYPHSPKPITGQPKSTDLEYQQKHRKLKNRLNSARNWYLLQQRFSPGILALVPCGDYNLSTDL